MNAVGRLLVAALAGCASESNEVAKPDAASDSSRTDAETGTLPTDAAVECSLATGCARIPRASWSPVPSWTWMRAA